MDNLGIIIKMLGLRSRYDLSLGDVVLIRKGLKDVSNFDEVDIAKVMSGFGNRKAQEDVVAHIEKEVRNTSLFRRR